MSELRQNLSTREWVAISPERLKGKKLQIQHHELVDEWPSHSDNCPFCPGNEARFNNVEIDRIESPLDHPWNVRCLENKFQIVSNHVACPIVPTQFEEKGIYNNALGCGSHELVIESPIHNKTFAVMTLAEIIPVIRMYLRRYRVLSKNPNNMLAIIFKNHGSASGASQQHPHSQIVAMRVVPNHVRHLVEAAMNYFDSEGTCVFCKINHYELDFAERIVYENKRFFAYVPYAAPIPYKIDILPKRHMSHIGDMNNDDIEAFSDCLGVTMRKLYNHLSNPHFNLIFRNPPFHFCSVPFYHWHLEIFPHIITPGGFELGSRVNVNVVTPEQAAKELRDTAG